MAKTLYIIRGLPGSGKSTLGEKLADNYMDFHPKFGGPKTHSYAADDWFYDEDGNYNFNPEELPAAHEECQSRVRGCMMDSIGNICVCNTFSQRWEAEPYINMAKQFDYTCVIIECQNNFKSVHGVPAESIERMKERWEPLKIDFPVML